MAPGDESSAAMRSCAETYVFQVRLEESELPELKVFAAVQAWLKETLLHWSEVIGEVYGVCGHRQ